MSLKYLTERAFKQLLHNADLGGSGEFDEDGEQDGLQLLTSQESAIKTLATNRVIIQALTGEQITPKARNLRMRVVVHVETAADPPDNEELDAEERAAAHAANVSAVNTALFEHATGLAARLSTAAQDAGLVITFFGLVAEGEVFIRSEAAQRAFRDSQAFTCTVAEQAST